MVITKPSSFEVHSSFDATSIGTAVVCLYVHFTPTIASAGMLQPGQVAGRSFGLVRRDLLLQIDPSVLDSELVTS
jgi:hypothetical protein